VQFLANRGYAVLQVNYRGSSGYGKNFYDKGFKQWGKQINADIDAGTRWLINQKIADPNRIAIYGYGLGGFIAMNAAINNSGLYKCAASNSGVLNLFSFLKTVPPYYQATLDIFYELIGNPISDADYLRQVSPVFHANKVNIPVYISQSSKDFRMNGNDALQFAKELTKMGKPVVFYEKMEVKSSLDREEARKKSYASLEQFLSENLKRP
jgi:dipeptidyl aminopeptidase/acylaminoacyl peptidase